MSIAQTIKDKIGRKAKNNGEELAEIKATLQEMKMQIGIRDRFPPNIRQLFAPAKNDQAELTRKLMTSDEDNYTKARIPSVFAMTTFDLFGDWIAGRHRSVRDLFSPDPANPNHTTFTNLYRVNSISLRGQSRDEYVSVMQPIGLNSEMLQFKMNEKAKLKEGNRK